MRFSSFSELLHHFAETTPHAPALVYGDDRRSCTYRALLDAVTSRAEALQSTGKTCIGVLADGSFDCVITVFGAVLAGLTVVLLDENAPDALLAEQIAYTDVDLLWGDDALTEDLSPALTSGVRDGRGKLLFFTSGTTENAKAVVLTEQSLMASAYNGGALLPLDPQDTLLCVLPLNHVFGFVCGLLWGLSCGASVALGRGPRHYIDDCRHFQPTALSAVPLLWGFLLKYNVINPELKLVLIGAGDCPDALLDAAKARGIRVSFGYGLTETSSGVALSLGDNPRVMTVCPDDRIQIAVDGEILISAPTCMMQGYYKREADTQHVLHNGVLHTGDLGYLDSREQLHITGRKKEILVLHDGTKLFLPEYERACAAALGTDEVCIVLQSDVPTLVIGKQADGDEKAVLTALQPVLEGRARGQQLRAVRFLSNPLPRTATGKIKRWEILQSIKGDL